MTNEVWTAPPGVVMRIEVYDRHFFLSIDIRQCRDIRILQRMITSNDERDRVGLDKVLADMNPVEAMELLKSRLEKTKSNAEFLLTMNLD